MLSTPLFAAEAQPPLKPLDSRAGAAGPLIGTPQAVRDPHWGDVLFYFYQGDYLQALTRLDAGEYYERLSNHQVEAQLLKGGLYLSLGQHQEAGRIFTALLNDNVTPDVRNRAWFYLAKIWYQRDYMAEATRALESIQGRLPGELESERRLLAALVLLDQQRDDDAIQELNLLPASKDPANPWAAYARFNIGVALLRKNRLEDATRFLDQVGQMPALNEELAAVRDKANVALSFALLNGSGGAELAKQALQRVRLQGPQSNRALLALGWAESAQSRYQRALVPWLQLRERNLLDSAVQESFLAVPYAYVELNANRQAAEQYTQAIQSFEQESVRLDESIAAIRAGKLLDTILENDPNDQLGWYWQLARLPDQPQTRYLYHLLATNEFHEGLKSYRDLKIMQRNLGALSQNVAAFDDMIEARRRAHAQREPVMRSVLERLDVTALNARKTALDNRFAFIERNEDLVGLATETEAEQWAKIKRIESVLARADEDDPQVQELTERLRRVRGVALWSLSSSFKARLRRQQQQSREIDVALKEIQQRQVLISRAEEEFPRQTEEFATRVSVVQPRIEDLTARLGVAADAQNRYLSSIAIKELQAQKQRLASYTVQARFALASIFDRVSSGAGAQP
jgi:tetratricopeptide (TPR) repeat protein